MKHTKNHTTNTKPMECESSIDASKRAKAWVESDTGRQQIKDLLRRSRETIARLLKARRVNPERLYKPMTI